MTEKPFDLIVEETRIKIQNTLDESGLPITVVAMILREMSSFASQREIAHIRNLKQVQAQEKAQKNENRTE